MSQALRPELQQAVEEVVASGFLGAALRVQNEEGEQEGAAGLARIGDLAAPPADGRFRIGSNTKTFAAALALRLAAEGVLDLDGPVAEHLSGWNLDRRITARMLLQHTSGLFNFTGELGADGGYLPGIPAPGTPKGDEWLDDRFRTYRPDELIAVSLARPPRFEPGTSWSYSNTNYVLLRLLVEQVTGRPFAGELRRLVLDPLGLSDTMTPESASELPEPHAHAYYRHGPETIDVTCHDPSWISTGGDMISTNRDLTAFLSGLLGGRLLPAALLAEMCTPHPTGIPGMGYGLGVFVQETKGGPVITHNGGIAGYATLMYGAPGGGTVMAASLTCVDDSRLSIAPAFLNAQRRLVGEVFG